MTRFFGTLGLSVLLFAGGISAAAATSNGYYEYRGSFIITGIDVVTPSKPTCAAEGYAIGDESHMRFVPPGASLGSNGTTWRLSIFWGVHAANFTFTSAPTSTLAKPHGTTWVGRGGGAYTVTPYLAITKQTPATITTSTMSVYLEGKIRNFANDATTSISQGCDITFRAEGVLKP